MSFSKKQEKRWVIAESAPTDWQSQFSTVPAVMRQLLWVREVRDKELVERFLNPSYEQDLHDPFLFKDMERVVERIFRAIRQGEKIFVYGDYDADGVTGSVILKSTLDALGAVAEVYMPHREKEGYGLNTYAVRYMAKQDAKLIITNDCGISNADEAEEAKRAGIDVIITDHHRIPELVPQVYAILHPLLPGENYPNKFLTGGGVAFKLAQALLRRVAQSKLSLVSTDKAKLLESGFEKWLLDLVAISTVADVGKLVGENRTLVKYGLIVLNKTRRVGLQKLIEAAGIKIGALSTWNIGWQIAPRINAAGRMDHANTAFALLVAEDIEKASALAEQLNKANQDRQKETDRVLNEAREQINGQWSNGDGQMSDIPYLLTAYSPNWMQGVIGLVAGRLMDEFQRPVIIGTQSEESKIVASARSIDQFNIVEALSAAREHIAKFGGHPKAAGFSVAGEGQWNKLIAYLQELAKQALHSADVRPMLEIDADAQLSQINWDFIKDVQALAPYGEGNPEPRFLFHGVRVVKFDAVGNNGAHLRLTVTDETSIPYKMIGFRCGHWCEKLKIGDLIDVVVEVGVNQWNGNREIEMKIVDLRFHETQ